MALTVSPVVFRKFTNPDGTPLAGGQLTTYVAGSTTLTPVYQDAAGEVPWPSTIILLADGSTGGTVFQPASPAVKYVLQTASGVVLGTEDNILANAPAS